MGPNSSLPHRGRIFDDLWRRLVRVEPSTPGSRFLTTQGSLAGTITIGADFEFPRAGGDRDGVEAGLPVRDEVAIGHDEAGADAADAETPAGCGRELREVVEVVRHWFEGLTQRRQGAKKGKGRTAEARRSQRNR